MASASAIVAPQNEKLKGIDIGGIANAATGGITTAATGVKDLTTGVTKDLTSGVKGLWSAGVEVTNDVLRSSMRVSQEAFTELISDKEVARKVEAEKENFEQVQLAQEGAPGCMGFVLNMLGCNQAPALKA